MNLGSVLFCRVFYAPSYKLQCCYIARYYVKNSLRNSLRKNIRPVSFGDRIDPEFVFGHQRVEYQLLSIKKTTFRGPGDNRFVALILRVETHLINLLLKSRIYLSLCIGTDFRLQSSHSSN